MLITAAVAAMAVQLSAYVAVPAPTDIAGACDQYGYLRSARAVREAIDQHHWPSFEVSSDETSALVQFLSPRFAQIEWTLIVGPHATHHMAGSGKVALQYPPGTGAVMAMFPEGSRFLGTQIVGLFVLASVLFAALYWAARREEWLGVILAPIVFGFVAQLIVQPPDSPSVVPAIAVVAVAIAAAYAARAAVDERVFVLASTLAGVAIGFSLLIRIPNVLFVPFVAWLVLSSRGVTVLRLLPAFLGGAVFVGAQLWFQHDVTGSVFESTYPSFDTTGPMLAELPTRAIFYAKAQGAEWLALAACTILVIAAFGIGVAWRMALLVVPSLMFFLTHEVAVPYYLTTALAAGSVALAFECCGDRLARRSWHVLLLGGIGTAAIAAQAGFVPRAPLEWPETRVPLELAAPGAFVWADHGSGMLEYYSGRPGFKLSGTNETIRRAVLAHGRTEKWRQYLLRDGGHGFDIVAGDVTALGGTLKPHGRVFGGDYYFIEWEAEAMTLPIEIGRKDTFDAKQSFHGADSGMRWSTKKGDITFRLAAEQPPSDHVLVTIHGYSLPGRHADVYLNDALLGRIEDPRTEGGTRDATGKFTAARAVLRLGGVNVLRFSVPTAGPVGGDQRELGFALATISVGVVK